MSLDLHNPLNVLLLIALGALAVSLLFLLFLFLSLYTVELKATKRTWKRTLFIEQFSVVNEESQLLLVPGDAYDRHPYPKTVVVPRLVTRTRVGADGRTEHYSELENHIEIQIWVRYKVDRWVDDGQLSKEDDLNKDKHWPRFVEDREERLGARRIGSRQEEYLVYFQRLDRDSDNELVRRVQTAEKASVYQVGCPYKVKMNRLEQPWWWTLKVA